MKVAIIGAAGAIGRATAAALGSRGIAVRLVGRSVEKLGSLEHPGAERVAADVATADGCRAALEGADAAVYTLGLPYTKRDFAQYPPMMEAFLAAARAAGTKRAVLITNVYPYGLPQQARVAETHPRVPVSVKGEWRKQQEDLFLAAHGQGLETLSLRLPNFYGPEAKLSLLDGVLRAAVRGKTADLLGPVDLPQELVFTPDVGPVVADLLSLRTGFEGAYNFAGAGLMTWRELATAIYSAAGREPRFRVAGPRLLRFMGLFSELMRELSEMSYLQTHPVVLDDTKLRALLPELRKTPYAEGLARTVRAYAQEAGATVPVEPNAMGAPA